MRFRPEALVLLLSAGRAFGAPAQDTQPAGVGRPIPSPTPSPTPTPTPRYKLIPYGFESAKDRSTVPLLRFEDQTEVRSLEMNAAIARFFDRRDDKGNMLRGATPGGAPTLAAMAAYRPHATAGLNLLGLAGAAVKEIRKQIEKRERMPPADPSPSPSPVPSAAPSPKPSPGRR